MNILITVTVTTLIISIFFLVLFIIGTTKKTTVVETKEEEVKEKVDAVVKIGNREIPVSFRGIDLKFTQMPDRKDYYNFKEDLSKVACDNSQETGYGLSLVVIQEVPGEYVVHAYFMARYAFGHLEEFVTIHDEFPETFNRVQKVIDAVLPIRK